MNISSIICFIVVVSTFYFLTSSANNTEELFLNLVISYMFSLICIILFLKSTLASLYNNDENIPSKDKLVCTLFEQPLSNNKIKAGLFTENGEILEIFESK